MSQRHHFLYNTVAAIRFHMKFCRATKFSLNLSIKSSSCPWNVVETVSATVFCDTTPWNVVESGKVSLETEFHVKWCLRDNIPREKTSHSDTFCVNINRFDQISQRHISTLCVNYCRNDFMSRDNIFGEILSRKRFFSTKLWNIVAMSDSFSRNASVFHMKYSRSDPISRATVLHTTPAVKKKQKQDCV